MTWAFLLTRFRTPRELREPGLGLGRDPVRTPMPWDGSENAGFTTARPWLPLNADWPTRNGARMIEETHSILTLHRRLLAMRRRYPALSIGSFALLAAEGDVLAYERRHGAERLIVALNLGSRSHATYEHAVSHLSFCRDIRVNSTRQNLTVRRCFRTQA